MRAAATESFVACKYFVTDNWQYMGTFVFPSAMQLLLSCFLLCARPSAARHQWVPDVQATSGVGFVFVEFADPAASVKAQKALHGRMFGDNQIDASYYSEDSMSQQVYK